MHAKLDRISAKYGVQAPAAPKYLAYDIVYIAQLGFGNKEFSNSLIATIKERIGCMKICTKRIEKVFGIGDISLVQRKMDELVDMGKNIY
ncbi:MAG: hypothetical protein K2L07_05000 [Lachnospiraceae bacterium]|nr:hypothetical protein [Lachnospiraceae bacterium]